MENVGKPSRPVSTSATYSVRTNHASFLFTSLICQLIFLSLVDIARLASLTEKKINGS